MNISKKSWHYIFMYSSDWWGDDDRVRITLCKYFWQLTYRLALTAIMMLSVMLIVRVATTIFVVAPVVALIHYTSGGAVEMGRMLIAALFVDGLLAIIVLISAMKQYVVSPLLKKMGVRAPRIGAHGSPSIVKNSVIIAAIRDHMAKRCSILEFTDD